MVCSGFSGFMGCFALLGLFILVFGLGRVWFWHRRVMEQKNNSSSISVRSHNKQWGTYLRKQNKKVKKEHQPKEASRGPGLVNPFDRPFVSTGASLRHHELVGASWVTGAKSPWWLGAERTTSEVERSGTQNYIAAYVWLFCGCFFHFLGDVLVGGLEWFGVFAAVFGCFWVGKIEVVPEEKKQINNSHTWFVQPVSEYSTIRTMYDVSAIFFLCTILLLLYMFKTKCLPEVSKGVVRRLSSTYIGFQKHSKKYTLVDQTILCPFCWQRHEANVSSRASLWIVSTWNCLDNTTCPA